MNLKTQQLSVPLTVGHGSRTGRRHVHRHMGCRTKPFLVRTHLSCQPGSWCTQPPLCGAQWHSWSRQGRGRAGSPRPCLLSHLRNTHRCTSRSVTLLCYPYSCTHLEQRTHFFLFFIQHRKENSPLAAPFPITPSYLSRDRMSRCARCKCKARRGCRARGRASLGGTQGSSAHRTAPRSLLDRSSSPPMPQAHRARGEHL